MKPPRTRKIDGAIFAFIEGDALDETLISALEVRDGRSSRTGDVAVFRDGRDLVIYRVEAVVPVAAVETRLVERFAAVRKKETR